jgi:hypothetical protein
MWCGHYGCAACWKQYFSINFITKPPLLVKCMEHDCNARVVPEMLLLAGMPADCQVARLWLNRSDIDRPEEWGSIDEEKGEDDLKSMRCGEDAGEIKVKNVEDKVGEEKTEESGDSEQNMKKCKDDVSVWTRLMDWCVDEYVRTSPGLMWCRNKTCRTILDLGDEGAPAACPKCYTKFCSGCDLAAHGPASCSELEDWDFIGGFKESEEEDSQTKALIALTTKACPNCAKPIEKNEGCLHMTCFGCRHEFCWVCMAT